MFRLLTQFKLVCVQFAFVRYASSLKALENGVVDSFPQPICITSMFLQKILLDSSFRF